MILLVHFLWYSVIEVKLIGNNKKICPNCGRKMKQQFIGLLHCKCGISWKKDIGYFEHTSDMVFALERKTVAKKTRQLPVIHTKEANRQD